MKLSASCGHVSQVETLVIFFGLLSRHTQAKRFVSLFALLPFSCKVLEYFEVVNTARADSSRPTMYQSSSSRMQRELFSPLSVWAQSFSIKGTG